MAGVKGALTTLVYIVCSAANSAQYIPYGKCDLASCNHGSLQWKLALNTEIDCT